MATKKTTTTPKSTRTNWKELYQDLPENVAKILREKRVKPDQLTTKTDGEILALGLSDVDLETIRAKYPSILLTEGQEKRNPSEALAKGDKPTEEAVATSDSHFHKFPRQIYGRSKRYKALSAKLDRHQALAPTTAIEKLVALAGDDKNIDLHINTSETGLRGEVKVPFSTGKTIRIEIFSDKTVTALNNNEFNFDVLLATPADMPKLARYAKVLGPKGLMPNPKNGTIIADPATRAKQMSSGASLAYKTEPKFPIIHLSLGKTSQKPEELTANLNALLKEIGTTKITSAYLTSNQTPSVKLDLSSF
jgi:large subunit ribosomal protein L1